MNNKQPIRIDANVSKSKDSKTNKTQAKQAKIEHKFLRRNKIICIELLIMIFKWQYKLH